MTATEIINISPQDRLTVEAMARTGVASAVRDFLLIGAWRELERNPLIKQKQRRRALNELMRSLKIEVVNG